MNNLQNLTIEIWVLAILIIVFLPPVVVFLWRNFEISEITPSAPWVKFVRKTTIEKTIHNLPQPDYGHFIGREKEIALINQILRPYPQSQHAVITIDGVGGIGKSALALEVAHRFLNNTYHLKQRERFGAIIWVSAKQSILTGSKIIYRKQAFRTLQDIYSAIAIALGEDEMSKIELDAQLEMLRKLLTKQRTLLIIDNLETIDDEEVLNFIRELPAPTKSIVTTRYRVDVAYSIRLTGMEWKNAKLLIAEESRKKSVKIDDEYSQRLFNRTGGIPLAIVWSIAQIGFGYSPDVVLNRLGQPTGDIARFCFEKVVENLHGKPAYRLLAALVFFENGAKREELSVVANMPELDRDDNLVELEKLSLVNHEGSIFKMLPLTREYMKGELEKDKSLKNYLERRLNLVLPPSDEIIETETGKETETRPPARQTTILFLSADPTDFSRLRVNEEWREIQEKLSLSKMRSFFNLEIRFSARPADISQALFDVWPQIVHFSGLRDALFFENSVGESQPIPAEALGALFEQFQNRIDCVVLNAAYSERQARAIAEHINYVIGMSSEIGDKAAIAFSIGFYQALGAGRSIEEAYKFGCVQIQLHGISEHLIPILLKKGHL